MSNPRHEGRRVTDARRGLIVGVAVGLITISLLLLLRDLGGGLPPTQAAATEPSSSPSTAISPAPDCDATNLQLTTPLKIATPSSSGAERFDATCYAAPAGSPFEIQFTNGSTAKDGSGGIA